MYCVEGWEVWGKWEGVLIKDLLVGFPDILLIGMNIRQGLKKQFYILIIKVPAKKRPRFFCELHSICAICQRHERISITMIIPARLDPDLSQFRNA